MNNHDYDYLNEFFKYLLSKSNNEKFYIYGIDFAHETKLEPQIEIVETGTPKKTVNELLDDYIDLVTLYELFGDEGYKSKSEYILGLLKEAE